jgi:hypothetical protein
MARLRKVDITTTKDFAGGDTRQIPFAGTIQVYKQGTTYVSGGPVNVAATNVTLTVRSVGRVIVGDTLVKESDIIAGTGGPPLVTVDTVTPGVTNTIRVDHTSGGNMTLSAGDRLIVTSNAPSLFGENTGNIGIANPFTTDATVGYGAFYCRERYVDAKLSGTGASTQLLRDQQSGETGSIVYASDFATVQQAVDSLPPGGGTVVLTELYNVTSYAPVLIDTKPGVKIVGGGFLGLIETGGGDTALAPLVGFECTDATKKILHVKNSPYCSLEDFNIKGARSGDTFNVLGIGLHVEFDAPQTVVAGITARRLRVHNCSGDGVQVENAYLSTWDYCQFQGNNGRGFVHSDLTALTHPHQVFINCWFMDNKSFGYHAKDVDLAHFTCCSFQSNGRSIAAGTGVAGAQVSLIDCTALTFDRCQWEGMENTNGDSGDADWGLQLRKGVVGARLSNIAFRGCKFICTSTAANGATPATALKLLDAHDCTFDDLFFNQMNTTGNNDAVCVQFQASVGASYQNKFGNFWIPNGRTTPITGTEGTDHIATSVMITQQYANDAARDLTLGATSTNHPYKLKGQKIYVLTPTAPTKKSQNWNGSAWENADT